MRSALPAGVRRTTTLTAVALLVCPDPVATVTVLVLLYFPLPMMRFVVQTTLSVPPGLPHFFFSREEERLHVHVQSPDGEAKFWVEPEIELARSYRLSDQDLKRVLQLVVDHEQEIRDAWHRHFDR